ncbi:MAG TPA: hypothetical protein PK668_17820 [Myxococcota bacterium]|nr:hypothetical protein [Myxococcota bacterium]HRY95820.1 hypothetical protein [Myxococcota bacterium]HSA22748.1 hypothetical protein [Myxococcota bacterium]
MVLKGKEFVEDAMTPYEKRGTFKVEDTRIELKLDGKVLSGALSAEGALKIEGLEGEASDVPSECSA